MQTLTFTTPDGNRRAVEISHLLNAGWAGRSQDDVAAHVAELAELGVAAPDQTPTVYAVSPYLATQTDRVPVQHGQTSGEAEWALVVAGSSPEDLLLTVACDHTDRALEAHGVGWSKNACLDVLGREAWSLPTVHPRFDSLRLRAWVGHGAAGEELVQDIGLEELLHVDYWIDLLREQGLLRPGTVLLSGTGPMLSGTDQFGESWRVELADDTTHQVLSVAYTVEPLVQVLDRSA